MALYKEVDYISEEVRSVASPGWFGRNRNGGGVEQFVIKETFEEVDQVSRAGGRGHGSGRHMEVRETKFEEDFNTRTGEFHERKDNIIFRSD